MRAYLARFCRAHKILFLNTDNSCIQRKDGNCERCDEASVPRETQRTKAKDGSKRRILSQKNRVSCLIIVYARCGEIGNHFFHLGVRRPTMFPKLTSLFNSNARRLHSYQTVAAAP